MTQALVGQRRMTKSGREYTADAFGVVWYRVFDDGTEQIAKPWDMARDPLLVAPENRARVTAGPEWMR
jgi:hypothetical protein